jgi:RNA polymerase sigma-70 factor (ECF subfamily)
VQKPSERSVPERPDGVAEDRRLVLLARGGDRSAFDALVVKYAGVVRSLTAARLGRGADADDAAQDTFLRAFRQLPRLDDPERFAGWLSTIAVNSALEKLRRGGRRKASSLTALVDEPAAPGAAVGVPIERAEDAARLAALVATLDEKTQIVLGLRFREEMAVKDIAAQMGDQPPAVAMRISRALRRLRDLMEEGDRR